MIRIEINPEVLTVLKTAFPNRNSAEKGLNTYRAKLEWLLLQSILHGRSTYDVQKNLFNIPLKELRDYGGRITDTEGRKVYIHEWLKQQHLELVKKEVQGNPFTGVLSKVSLTNKVKSTIDPSNYSPKAIFDICHPDFLSQSSATIANDYHILTVDLTSLSRYIHTLPTTSAKGSVEQKLLQAHTLFLGASAFEGQWPQKKIKSPFGRTYYEGTSIQNINKDLRRAVLGGAFEYDIRSSVVSWKLGFASAYLRAQNLTVSVEDTFPHSFIYSTDKKPLIEAIRLQVYHDDTLSCEQQTRNIKDAMTALNFGARLSESSYKDSNGRIKLPSLKKILTDGQELKRFNYCPYVVDFKAEQDRLNRFIIQQALTAEPSLRDETLLKTKNGKLSHNKLISYLYQHSETEVMNQVKQLADYHRLPILAHIHDAIIFKGQLPPEIKATMENAMQTHTDNPYWALGETELKGY